NLFTLHNDWRRMSSVLCDDMRLAPFQIDADIGFTAAVNEMLLCSADGRITLLPALPDEWKCGRISGLLTVGGWHVSILWNENEAEVVIEGGFRDMEILSGERFRIVDDPKTVKCGEKYILKLTRI
ncbi:MAG: hypothetical protein MJ175_07220, partial [Clostridia bacterium]|nr:hypothetical protein [Clostridia bacterium]